MDKTHVQMPWRTSDLIAKAVGELLQADAHTATLYVSATETVRVTRKRYGPTGRKRFPPRVLDLTVTVGRPNYRATRFIKACKRAKEPFPVKRIQLTFPAPPRKSLGV